MYSTINRFIIMSITTKTALIIEPNAKLDVPYQFLPSEYHTTRVDSMEKAEAFLLHTVPHLVLLSASFSAERTRKFLLSLKQASYAHLPGLILVVDLSHSVSSVIGTTWGETAAVLCSLSQKKEIVAVLDRLNWNQ